MGTLLYIAHTLDGYIADELGGVDWLDPYHREDEDYGYAAFFERVGALAMGAATYRQMLDWQTWPYGETPAWVFSHEELPAIDGADVRFTTRPPQEVVREIERSAAGDLWLVGGGRLAATFLDAGLVDELALFVAPVLLGGGVRLFQGVRPASAALTGTAAYESGLVELRYRLRRSR